MLDRLKIISLFVLAGVIGSCKHPLSPPPAPADSVTISGLKSGYTQIPYTFKTTINFSSQPALEYKWVFLDSTVTTMTDSIVWRFTDTGRNIFHVNVLQVSDSTVLCTALDTIVISDTIKHDTIIPPNPNDTTSHNFTWTQFTNVNGENNMTGCWVFGANDIYACNQYLYHYDGNSWTRATLNGQAPGALSGFSIFGFNDNDFWIFAYDAVFHWNGTKVIETRLENTGVWIAQDGSIHSAWGTSSNDMYFVGDSGTILHFDGTNWTKMTTPTTNQLNSIWGTSDNNIWAAGFNDQTAESALVHFDGVAWTSIDPRTLGNISPGNDGLNAVWCIDSAGHSVITASGSHVWRRTDAKAWFSDSGGVTNAYSGGFVGLDMIQGNSANDIFTAGSYGFISHWNGASWHRFDQYYIPGGDAAFAQMSIKGNTVCFAGVENGTSWIAVGQRQ